jgi:hypothetical protein
LVSPFEKLFGDIFLYSPYSRSQREPAPPRGIIELKEDGSNLDIVLLNILRNRDKRRKFSNLVKDLLPFVEDLDVEKRLDKPIQFEVQETYAPGFIYKNIDGKKIVVIKKEIESWYLAGTREKARQPLFVHGKNQRHKSCIHHDVVPHYWKVVVD